jgi:molybdopterin/thiamine biosynthesis adenylyltransferase
VAVDARPIAARASVAARQQTAAVTEEQPGDGVRPKLKNAVWHRAGDELSLISEPETQIVLADPEGHVEALLGLLRDGTRDQDGLVAAMADRPSPPNHDDVGAAIAALDELGVLEDASPPAVLPADRADRYFSNLAFFTTYASLSRPAASFQRTLLDAHVLFLGTGGLGSTAIQALTGAGVGRMTLLDSDKVEARNFARQYLYRESDIGEPKAERAAAWVQAFDSRIDVRPVARWIAGPGDIADLLADVDLVIDGVDHPRFIDVWVNEACVTAGVPFVRGGMIARRLLYWSVDPGRSACLACQGHAQSIADQADGVPAEQQAELQRVNRGIGPVASMVGAMVAMEAMRYLTGFAAPIAAGRVHFIDFATGAEEVQAWEPWPDCPVCQAAPARAQAPAGADG